MFLRLSEPLGIHVLPVHCKLQRVPIRFHNWDECVVGKEADLNIELGPINGETILEEHFVVLGEECMETFLAFAFCLSKNGARSVVWINVGESELPLKRFLSFIFYGA